MSQQDARKRQWFTAEQKAQAIRRHVMGKEEVSAICQDLGLAPNQFYRWRQELFDHAAVAFAVKKRGPKPLSRETQLERQVEVLEQKLVHKDEVDA